MFLQGLSKVERIEIVGYKYPTSFWQIGVNSLEHIRSQRPSDLHFHLLLSFMEEERKELEQGLACRLQYLALRNCECLMKLQQLLNSLSFLRGISIEDCPELVSIPETALPSELRFIVIKKCDALESNTVEISSDLLGWLDPIYREDTTGIHKSSCRDGILALAQFVVDQISMLKQMVFSVLNPSRKKRVGLCCF
ncbi:hypothetical protein QYF36_001024 [Acer negundo]|nr:hypothetical protein QYF36_001024 [Acer negundo]